MILFILIEKNYSGKYGAIFDNLKNYAFPFENQKSSDKGNSLMLSRELKQTGNLICYEGEYSYTYFDEESRWYGSKNISANLVYKFGLGIDFSTINIEVDNNKVIVDIPRDKIKISYIELENKDSTLRYFNSIFMEKYDINDIQRKCREAVENDILKEKAYFDEAVSSIKERVKSIAEKFGYGEIKFK